ncbi:MAG: DNA polymerase III subunit delta, partial [Acholeplasmatales bacterium]|nr:DNA polymerase III subunit delta [Acholeplasmatales bacterium]
ELVKVMNNPESNNVVVFTSNEKIDFGNENMAKLRKYSVYFDIRIKNIPLDQYAKNELINRGFQIDSAALTQLVNFSANMSSLKTNIEILTSYKAEEKKIVLDDVIKMIKQPLEDNIFSLIDVVLAKDKKSIYRIYRDLKIENIKSSYIISMLINKFQEMYNVYILARGGADQQAMMDLFNVSSGKAYYMLKNSKQASLDEIKTNLDLLNKLDYDIKSGKIDEEVGLELYLLK